MIFKPAIGALLCVFLSGCSIHEVTDEVQHASFVKLSDQFSGGKSLESYLGGRIAFLLASDQVKITDTESQLSDNPDGTVGLGFNFEFTYTSKLTFGSAAAIDPRGYFITAAHCLKDGDIYAFYVNSKKEMNPCRIRVIWRGTGGVNNFDFAVFHVPLPSYYHFTWSEDFEKGDAVFSAGTSIGEDDNTTMYFNPAAGNLIRSWNRKSDDIPYQRILHDTPIRKGNSGGPLLDSKGKIIGINFAGSNEQVRVMQPNRYLGVAVRPDLDWLKTLIDEDYSKLEL